MLELIFDNTDNTATLTAEGWRARGRCRDLVGTLTPLFFSEDFYEIARAKAICSACPVLSECLDAAKSSHEPWGVWGGELFENGHVRTDKRPRGRPPTRPRPLVAEEAPLPPDLVRA